MAQQQQQRRASMTALTFPILPFSELTDLLHNALGLNITAADAAKPSPQLVARVYNSLLDLVTGVSREEVAEVIQNALKGIEHAELYREALTQLTLLREMEEVCRASLFPDFKLEDLVAPTGPRFQKILSAILNFGRFREDVFQKHAEQSEGLVKLEKELKTLEDCGVSLQESIKIDSERLEVEAPMRQRLELEKAREQFAVKSLGGECAALEKAYNEDKKRGTEVKAKCDSVLLEINKIENQISDIRAQIVSSPEKIQAGLVQLKERVEQERAELEKAKEEERTQLMKKEDLRRATAALEFCFKSLESAEEKAEEASREEEKTRSRKTMIDSHSYRVKELQQREQEALRENKLAEERNNRLNAQRDQKIKQAKEELSYLVRERENRERHASEDSRKASRLRAEAAMLRTQIEKARVEHENLMSQRSSLYGDVTAAFDAYVEGVNESIRSVQEACAMSSVRN